MRRRSAQYWLWVNSRLPGRNHEETLEDGTQIEVQARINPQGMTQVFVGVHRPSAQMRVEEFYDRTLREPLAQALEWGLDRARDIITGTACFKAPHKIQTTLGPLIQDECALALRRMDMSEEERRSLKARDAWTEYLSAKEAMLALMRSARVDANAWETQTRRLREAIDRRASLARVCFGD
ncbi:hypothetical protein ACNT2N_15095 [Pseudomonas thivervalensis]|uniref:Uncharacterized protein n=1 Tax=Pseudomonas thivervalensis TaxID=86265 RepID=A0A176NGP3_9PSED|nr:hypothetical protein [Pseudomonas thivervalensis]AXA54575.1 hypothetical protein CE140_09460 [Pseudomonas thivervalensis]AXA60255.1 hypothetical protein CEQ51_09300 [Pseudomonas thivervalensis]OAB50275.1 hypothetical protein APS14_10880 [Pseudomonas thivervalensis]SDF81635.1 hypothetical protein SAMN04490204_1944 [Pseudomonas thivervalensis]